MIPLCMPSVTDEMKGRVLEVLESGRFVKGPEVEEFEKEFSSYCGVKYGTAVSSGTASIYMALRALEVGEHDEVITVSYSFIASASPILLANAKPVFVDIGDDYNLDMDDLEEKITEKTKVVICVHLYGQMCDMGRLMELKEKYGFHLIEDAAQAHGAEYKGRKSGSFGNISCFSFYPSKNMTVCGDGGMALTDDEDLDGKLKMLREHGLDRRAEEGKYRSKMLGFNFRMSEISAVIGKEQLKHLDEWVARRREIADLYRGSLTDEVIKPMEFEKRKHTYHLYVIRTKRRDELKEYLAKNEIETGIHYPSPIHKQPIFTDNWNLPKTEKICGEVLSLSMYPTLSKKQVEYVCEKINEFF